MRMPAYELYYAAPIRPPRSRSCPLIQELTKSTNLPS
jgi:hypothetical protein